MTKETKHLLLRITQGGLWAQDLGSVKPDYTVHSNNNNKHPKSQMIFSPASVTKGTNLEALSSEFFGYGVQMKKALSGLILHSYWKSMFIF